MSITWIKKPYNHRKDGATLVVNRPPSGRRSRSWNDLGIHQLQTLFMENHCTTHMRTCSHCGNKNWLITLQFEWGFGPVESVCKVCAEAENDGAEATIYERHTEHAGLNTMTSTSWRLSLLVMSRWLIGTVYKPITTVESFIITKAKIKTQGNAKIKLTVFSSRWCITSMHHKDNKAKVLPKNITRRSTNSFFMLCNTKYNMWAMGTLQFCYDCTNTQSSHLIQSFLSKHNIPLVL